MTEVSYGTSPPPLAAASLRLKRKLPATHRFAPETRLISVTAATGHHWRPAKSHRKGYTGYDYAAHLRRAYSMTPAEYDRLLAEQEGKCAICRTPPAEGKRLVVDHDHYRGKRPRGLLCVACNTALGKFKDRPAFLQAAIKYLKKPPRKVQLTEIFRSPLSQRPAWQIVALARIRNG